MSDFEDNSALLELLAGISDRRIRRKVKKLLEFGTEAVRSLGELDSALYTRGRGEEQLQVVSDAVLVHIRRLLEFLGTITKPAASGSSSDGDFDFSSGDSLDLSKTAEEVLAKRKARADSIVQDLSEEDTWDQLAQELDTLQYGLGSELKEFDRRFSEALKNERTSQALRDLNDATNSLMDGVFALISTVYERFLGYVDPERMIPGHRDTLGKAIAVRRALTELRQEVQELNRSIQDSSSNQAAIDMSYKILVESLEAFVESEVFLFLRASDRQEFDGFLNRLKGGSVAKNRLDCEGLDKYLDSLAVVSQRDVLLKHDADLKQKIFDEIETSFAVAISRPAAMIPRLDHAFALADGLFGLNEELDSLAFQWSRLDEVGKRNPFAGMKLARRLREIVEPPKQVELPKDGDFL